MPGYAAQLAQRRAEYVAWIIETFRALEPGLEPTDGRLWALNHARLFLDEETEPANRYFASVALTQDADIFFIRHLQTLLDFQESPRLSGKARQHLTGLLAAWPHNELSSVARWPCIHTENHQLMQLTIGMFARQCRGEDMAGHVEALDQVLTWRFERGWVEWNSPCYQYHYSNPLIVLAEHAPAPLLRQKARDLLNVLLAERALLSVNGYLGGPCFRCRTADANDSLTARKVAYLEDNRYDKLLPRVWLAFGLGEPRFDFATARVPGLEPAGAAYASGNEPRLKQDEGMLFACSAWEPHPIVVALAQEALTRPHLIYEGRRFIGWPDDEAWATQRWQPAAITYYNTPHISMASVHSDGWICQSRYSNVMFGADPSQNLRVEIILPGLSPTKRRHESRGRVVQHKNWLLGQGTLFEDGGVRARRIDEWDMYRVGKGLCAHYGLADDYHVLQVSDLDTYPGEEAFVQALAIPHLSGHEVQGASVDGDRIAVDTRDMSLAINGTKRPHPPAMLHDCPYMTSEYGSGRITITTEAGSVTFDGTRAKAEGLQTLLPHELVLWQGDELATNVEHLRAAIHGEGFPELSDEVTSICDEPGPLNACLARSSCHEHPLGEPRAVGIGRLVAWLASAARQFSARGIVMTLLPLLRWEYGFCGLSLGTQSLGIDSVNRLLTAATRSPEGRVRAIWLIGLLQLAGLMNEHDETSAAVAAANADALDAACEHATDSARRALGRLASDLTGLPEDCFPPPGTIRELWWNAVVMAACATQQEPHLGCVFVELLRHAYSGGMWPLECAENEAFRRRALTADANCHRFWSYDLEMGPLVTPRGRMFLHFLTDPLRILNIGNAFDSCLRLGGLSQNQLLGWAVNTNVRVVAARDDTGRLLGRQTLGLSLQDAVGICPYVPYPRGDQSMADLVRVFTDEFIRETQIDYYEEAEVVHTCTQAYYEPLTWR